MREAGSRPPTCEAASDMTLTDTRPSAAGHARPRLEIAGLHVDRSSPLIRQINLDGKCCKRDFSFLLLSLVLFPFVLFFFRSVCPRGVPVAWSEAIIGENRRDRARAFASGLLRRQARQTRRQTETENPFCFARQHHLPTANFKAFFLSYDEFHSFREEKKTLIFSHCSLAR